tara:strand:- start:250 stop:1023 length:774 start_codon:yes stop_codon:yes gene_type:complete
MKDWDKELFIRIPKALFDDAIWIGEEFTKQMAYLDLYFLAHDNPNNTGAIIDINGYMAKVEVGEVPRGLRFYANRWKWSTKKVSNFLNRLEELGYIQLKGNTSITVFKILGWIPRRNAKETQRKHGGNRSDTPMMQLDNKDNKKKKNNKERDAHSSFDFSTLIEEYKDIDVQQSYDKYILYHSNKISEKGFRNWLDKDRKTGFNQKGKEYKRTKTCLFIAYCSKCGSKHFPDNFQLKQGSSCCRVEYTADCQKQGKL